MKINWNEKDRTKAIYSIIVIFISILFFFFIYRIDDFKENVGIIMRVFYPFIIGGVFAFLLNMPLTFLENKLGKLKIFEKFKKNNKRKISMVLTYILFILFIILFFSMLIPQLYDAIGTLIDNASSFFTTANYNKLESFFKDLKINKGIIEFLTTKIEGVVDYVTNFMKGILPWLGNVATGVVTTTINWFVGFIISIYFLIDKERFIAMSKKMIYSFVPKRLAGNSIKIAQKINVTMKGYIGGQLIVVSILGVLVTIALAILGVKGAVAMGFIIAITDLIPIIGPWIGSAPVFLMISVQDFNKALIFILIILAAQQIEENLVRPRVQSEKLGISSFWVLAAILVGGSLFGIVGMVVGVPIFVVIYQIVKEISEYMLTKKGLPVDTNQYKIEENELKSRNNEEIDDKILDINDKNKK
ncbi:AI-2E family transporter [Miniphocaeibacter massiliensis]|uniref:AI-2E family transporter n=1 Tax=Miniphocaeibacter massiliensis TaxID=2041841 RepID=UPI000C1BAF68|nr:AI-2E family transporter [Miniphocaeibacter massiliensis]